MGLSHTQVITRYKNKSHYYARGSSIHFDGDVLESIFLGDLAVRGEWGSGIEYIINGDAHPFVTHNVTAINLLRSPIQNNIVQIPFSALAAAGLVKTTKAVRYNAMNSTGLDRNIRIIDSRDDRTWTVCAVCEKPLQKEPYGVRFTSYTEAVQSGELVGWFYSKANPWNGGKSLVERDGLYRFKRVHAHDNTDLCTSPIFQSGETKEVHELGATVIRQSGRYFISSVDHEDPRRTYFLSELPGPVKTIDEAYAALIPPAVAYAKALGRKIIRQGDMFAILTDTNTKDLPRPTLKWANVHASSHVATELRYHLGRTFIRGTLRHRPPGRRADHGMKKLGKNWWEAHRNTAKQSWQVLGRVD
jgi:hypothetical protein